MLLPVLPILALFLWTSHYGLDFGFHWDEASSKFESIKDTLQSGIFLQGGPTHGAAYNYGGLNYILTWAGFLPEVTHFLINDPFTREALSAEILPDLFSLKMSMRVRRIYLFLCALSIVWVYRLSLVLGRSRIEAFWGAAILAGSWEFAYHSRWIAPDGVMAQFVLLSFLCLALGMTRKTTRWFDFAAFAAGLAIGTKYTAALVLPFIVAGAAYALWQEGQTANSILKRSARLIGVASVTFLMTSPGILIDPFRFFAELETQRYTYANGWYGYTVKPGFPHLFAMGKYFSTVLFSHYWLVSVWFAAFCLIGIIAFVMEFRPFTFLTMAFTLAYIAYFSEQAAMIVRNLIVVVPFLCLAAARGISTVSERLGARSRWALAAALAASLAVNYGWEIYSAIQIGHRHQQDYFAKQFAAYVRKSPSTRFFISAKLIDVLREYVDQIPENLIADPEAPHSKVAFLQSEGADVRWENWPANSWGMYEVTFGAQEVNLDAYPTFVGNERIIVTSTEHFKKLPIKAEELAKP